MTARCGVSELIHQGGDGESDCRDPWGRSLESVKLVRDAVLENSSTKLASPSDTIMELMICILRSAAQALCRKKPNISKFTSPTANLKIMVRT